VQGLMRRLRIPEDVPIEHNMVTKSIERAQRQVESQNFEIRKNVLKYDEVMNRQREVIYNWRSGVLRGEDSEALVRDWIDQVVTAEIEAAISDDVPREDWDWDELQRRITQVFATRLRREEVFGPRATAADVAERFRAEAQESYTARTAEIGPALLRRLEQTVVLSVVDNKWREHLAEMDYLRTGVGLRAMGQRDPLVEYQREAYDMFAEMVEGIRRDAVRYLFHAQVVEQPAKVDPVVRLQATGGAALKKQASAKDKVGRQRPLPLRQRPQVQTLPRGGGRRGVAVGNRAAARAPSQPQRLGRAAMTAKRTAVGCPRSGGCPARGCLWGRARGDHRADDHELTGRVGGLRAQRGSSPIRAGVGRSGRGAGSGFQHGGLRPLAAPARRGQPGVQPGEHRPRVAHGPGGGGRSHRGRHRPGAQPPGGDAAHQAWNAIDQDIARVTGRWTSSPWPWPIASGPVSTCSPTRAGWTCSPPSTGSPPAPGPDGRPGGQSADHQRLGGGADSGADPGAATRGVHPR